MKRVLGIVAAGLAVCVAISGPLIAAEEYFPKGVFGERTDGFVHEWYGKQLRALREPSLYRRPESGRETYRFLWLRTFHNPVAVRLEILPDGTGELHVKRTDGAGGYEPGKLITDELSVLPRAEVDAFLELVRDTCFWRLSSRIESLGLDGAQWVVEGSAGGCYHLVDRWTPQGGGIREIGLYLLKLSGLAIPEREIY